MTLTDKEREKFAMYLEQQSASDDILMEQMRKIDTPAVIINKLYAESMAAKVVAIRLRSIETETLS